MATTSTTYEPPPTRRSITATRPLMGWRTVDILTVAFLGAAFGVAFWAWGIFYNGPVTALQIGYAPLLGLFVGPWLLAGVVGGLVVRRPGAALFCEVVAALVSMIPGTAWGAGVLFAGILQGLGAELAFAILGYRFFGVAAAALAGALSTPLEWLYETGRFPDSWASIPVLSSFAGNGGYYAEWVWRDKLAYLGCMALSGIVLAGVLAWVVTRALAAAGALSAFPPGQERRESRAV
ncbi:ECF transporter S component [Phycicoccus flavus]|uniref:ECF transporter S component n=1 Tax=Phycicoccus flavus TaxID=2502783 RepID=UPI000FEB92EE|nr:ECF transporter S component [Phycicoccus flavus]NHA69371.1 ECF transporter S component [Phycicoccus flavus]